MRKLWSKLTVYGICGLAAFGGLTYFPQSPLLIEAQAHLKGTDSGANGALHNSETIRDQSADGKAKTALGGWEQNPDGWKYKNTDGSYVKGGFSASDGHWYYFDQDGYMVKGWQQVGDNWYYFDSAGHMVTGEAVINDKHYFFNAAGKLNKN